MNYEPSPKPLSILGAFIALAFFFAVMLGGLLMMFDVLTN